MAKRIRVYTDAQKLRIKECAAKWYVLHKEEKNAKSIAWAKANPHKQKEHRSRYYQTHRQQRIDLSKKCTQARLNRDAHFRIKHHLRGRIHSSIREAKLGTRKASTTIKLLSCSWSELMRYLESKFLPGMNWENYGIRGWHMDHIRPCASFNLHDPEQQKQCFHYSNLQPMWAKDNISKGAKYHGS